jgi:hypothetical protein
MATVQNPLSTTYSLSNALLTGDVPQFNPLAPSAQPLTMLGEGDAASLDERLPPNSDTLLMNWLQSDVVGDPDLNLPGPFMEAFKEGREMLLKWCKDASLDGDTSKLMRQAARLTQEYEANKELAYFYINSVQKG